MQTATAAAKSLQWCLTLCDPRDSSPPGSPVPGILQARTLEWSTECLISDLYPELLSGGVEGQQLAVVMM